MIKRFYLETFVSEKLICKRRSSRSNLFSKNGKRDMKNVAGTLGSLKIVNGSSLLNYSETEPLFYTEPLTQPTKERLRYLDLTLKVLGSSPLSSRSNLSNKIYVRQVFMGCFGVLA